MTLQGCRGLTLLELLTGLAIASVLLGLGISGFSQLITKTRQNALIQSTIISLERTRNLAVSRADRVALCNMSPEGECQSEWTGTYIGAFIDRNKSRIREKDEELIFLLPWHHETARVTWQNWLADPVITYQPDGSVVSNGTLWLRDHGNNAFAKLVINKTGRVRIEKL